MLFLGAVGTILLLQNRQFISQKYSYKSLAAVPTAISWDRTQPLNYLWVEIEAINPVSDAAALKGHLAWKLTDYQFDIRDPDYRLYFLSTTRARLKESGKQGLVFGGLFRCSTAETEDCPPWREIAMKDFMAQVRQYFSDKTVLYQFPPELDLNQKELYAHYLLQLDGVMVKRDQKEALLKIFSGFVPKNILAKKLILTY